MEINEVLLEKNIACPMRDGTILYADVYRPNVDKKFPVLLKRLPYDKDSPFYSHRYLDTNRLVQNGYIVILQDVRGRFASEGEFIPIINESEDGYDAVEWAAKLPYSTGEVGMFGMSYYGYTQLLAAKEQPPHLRAIFPTMTSSGSMSTLGKLDEETPYSLDTSASMALETFAPDLLKRKYKDPKEYAEKMEKLTEYIDQLGDWINYMPINEWPPLKELEVGDYFFETLNGDVSEEDSSNMSVSDKYDQIQVPAYHVAGWYDNFLLPTIQNYNGLAKKAENKEARDNQKLLIGPWAHGVFNSSIGERSFGMRASGDSIDQIESLTDLHIRWFDHWLKEKDTLNKEEAPIKLFIMGINKWREENEWPLARTSYTPYYLHSNGRANTRFGDGSLSLEKPKDKSTDTYIYDPKDPVPTHGGATLYGGGPRDQRPIEERKDVLVYTSDPLKVPLEVTGPIKVKLWAKTDAESTDFTAKLMDVQPDGTAYNLTDGIVRTKKQKKDNSIGEVVEYEIDLWSTSNVFLPGHCIRVDISSSCYPKYDANLNTGKTMINSAESIKANQIIFHEKEYASHILLPIIPTT